MNVGQISVTSSFEEGGHASAF